jgi:hypothetical protein
MASDPPFLSDVLYSDDAALRKLALERLRMVSSIPIEIDVDADARTRAEQVARLRDKLLHATAPAIAPATAPSRAPPSTDPAG